MAILITVTITYFTHAFGSLDAVRGRHYLRGSQPPENVVVLQMISGWRSVVSVYPTDLYKEVSGLHRIRVDTRHHNWLFTLQKSYLFKLASYS